MSQFGKIYKNGNDPEKQRLYEIENVVEKIKDSIVKSNGKTNFSNSNKFKIMNMEGNKFIGEIEIGGKKYYFTSYPELKNFFGREVLKNIIFEIFKESKTKISDGDHYPTFQNVEKYEHTKVVLDRDGNLKNAKQNVAFEKDFTSLDIQAGQWYTPKMYKNVVEPIIDALNKQEAQLDK